MKNPIYITVDDGDLFQGHQGHWADCFFSNATEENIRSYLENFYPDSKVDIREMSNEELIDYPEAISFQQYLIKEYGEC